MPHNNVVPISPYRVIVLLTDFGLESYYVGQMKGVMLEICPELRVVDLTHNVTPQSIREGAYILEV